VKKGVATSMMKRSSRHKEEKLQDEEGSNNI